MNHTCMSFCWFTNNLWLVNIKIFSELKWAQFDFKYIWKNSKQKKSSLCCITSTICLGLLPYFASNLSLSFKPFLIWAHKGLRPNLVPILLIELEDTAKYVSLVRSLIKVTITFLIEMVELTDFGHMIISTTYFESHDNIL